MSKKQKAVPVGVDTDVMYSLSPESGPSAELPLILYARPIKKQALNVLNTPLAGNRLALILGIMVTMGLGVAVFLILDPLLLMGTLLSPLYAEIIVRVLTVLYVLLGVGLTLFATLPLMSSVYRMAVLMTEVHGAVAPDGTVQKIGLGELFYPLTSRAAYGRTLYVAFRSLACCLMVVGPSAVFVAAAAFGIKALTPHVTPFLVFVLWFLTAVVALAALVLLSRLAVRMSGLAYEIFAHEEIPVKALRQDFKSRRPAPALPAWLLGSFGLPVLLSFAAVIVPLLIHTVPHMLLSWASMSRFLSKTPVAEGACLREEEMTDAMPEADTASLTMSHVKEVS